MKTRILYPKEIWHDKSFHKLSTRAKNLSLYLIANDNLGLTRMYPQKDLELQFILGLTESTLEKLKRELEEAELFYFYKEWVFINNDFSYCDYEGRDRVMQAKKKEESSIPSDIKEYFKGVNKGLITGYKPPINHKPKTINHKSKIKKEEKDEKRINYREELKTLMTGWNKLMGTKKTSIEPMVDNYKYWREQYSLEQIKDAIKNYAKYKNSYWNRDADLVFLFRTKNSNGPCDYIADWLNLKNKVINK
jgi:hypothetical protein